MNSTNRFKIYIQQVMALASTLVVKSSLSAERINERLLAYGNNVNLYDPRTWKYYINLAGLYHSSDTRMTVTSLDTMEIIEFNQANLSTHIATAEAYKVGSRQYMELLTQYPSQERLIMGILHPCDLDTVIDAEDYAILAWPSYLVEENEYGLVARVGEWIKLFQHRWDNRQYNISDELYKAGQLAVMYVHLVPVILNLRLQACKSNEAHSFHVFHYLASHGFDERYFEFLTVEQRLFFYRNISYIEHNGGSADTLTWLVDAVMTKRGLPLGQYLMTHDLSKMKETGIESLTPQALFKRIAMNLPTQQFGSNECSLQVLLEKQDVVARDNALVRVQDIDVIDEKLIYSLANKVNTKVMESSAVDYSHSGTYPFEWILLHHWLYCAYSGILAAYVSVNNPRTGERISLSGPEAVMLYVYAFSASLGKHLISPPVIVTDRVTRSIKPSVANIIGKVDVERCDQTLVNAIVNRHPLVRTMRSSQAFYDFAKSIYASSQWQIRAVSSQGGLRSRAYAKSAVSMLYSDRAIDLSTVYNGTYQQWFTSRGIDISTFDEGNFTQLWKDIVGNGTGLDRNAVVSTRDVQAAMIDIMRRLSSYSVQYLTQITDSSIVYSNYSAVRYDGMAIESTTNVNTVVATLEHYSTQPFNQCNRSIEFAPLLQDIGVLQVSTVKAQAPIAIKLDKGGQYAERDMVFRAVNYTVEATPSSEPGTITVPGLEETYNILAPAQRARRRSIYSPGAFIDVDSYPIYFNVKAFQQLRQLSITRRVFETMKPVPGLASAGRNRQYGPYLGATAQMAGADKASLVSLNPSSPNSLTLSAAQIAAHYRIVLSNQP